MVSGTFGLVRYLPTGALDAGLGAGGRARTGFPVAAVNLQVRFTNGRRAGQIDPYEPAPVPAATSRV